MKLFVRILLVAIAAILLYAGYMVSKALPILSGYGAKLLCSCTYVAGRAEESILSQDLSGFLYSLADFRILPNEQAAVGSVWGMAKRKAIFREDLGCTLVAELSEEEIRNQPFKRDTQVPYDPDTIAWPLGNVMSDSVSPFVDQELLKLALDSAFRENVEYPILTRAVVVVHKGQLLAERYADGFDHTSPLLGWSMSKSVTQALVGLLVRDGKLNIMDPAPVQGWEDERKAITLDQLLRMSSGLEWDENYFMPSGATNMLFRSADMGGYAATAPLAYAPDEFWYYSSGTSNIVSKIVRQAVGDEQYHNFPYDSLFWKIGMTSMIMEPDASGTYVGSSYGWATARDWARFGLLYLNDGYFNGEQILPEGWAQYAATPTPASNGGYGAHFWLNARPNDDPRKMQAAPDDTYYPNGFEGQRIFIVPSRDLVVVRLGNTKYGNFDNNRLIGDVLKAIGEEN